jgi:hypothetical protein
VADPVTHRDAVFAVIVLSPFLLAWLGDMLSGGAVSAAGRGAVSHGRAQVASEGRRAKQAVVDGSKAKLRQRLEDGKAKGPKSAIWWGVAAAKGARKVHRALRRTGERSVSLPAAGPFRRVRDAAVAGGAAGYRRARDAAKARRASRPTMGERARQARRNASAWRTGSRPDHATGDAVATGVCDGCGVMAAKPALKREGGLLLCVLCRVPAAADVPAVPGDTGTAGALPAGAVAAEGDGVAYGELVPELALAGATTEGEIMAKSDKELLARAHPADLRELAKRELDRGHLEASGAYLEHAKELEQAGRSMQRPGQIARRTAHAPAAVGGSGGGGDITTHGDWDRLTQLIAEALEVTTRCKEAMLGHLTAADAGRTQMADIRNWADQTQRAVSFIRMVLAETNQRIYPLIDAVNAAGGPSEVASPGYHSDF